MGPACSPRLSWIFGLVLTGPGTAGKQIHLGVPEGLHIMYIWRVYFLVRSRREAGPLAFCPVSTCSQLPTCLLPSELGSVVFPLGSPHRELGLG